MEFRGSVAGKIAGRTALAVARAFGKILKYSVVSVLAVVLFVVLFTAAFFATPEFYLPSHQVRSLITKYVPQAIAIKFDKLSIQLVRPGGLPFAKYLVVEAEGVCVNYEKGAVDACFKTVSLAVAGGWGGTRLEGEKWYMPRLMSIDPIKMTGGVVTVDLPKLPPSDPDAAPSSIDYVNILRTEILPKWLLDGSVVELDPLTIRTSAKDGYTARFFLTTREGGDTLRAKLIEFKELRGPMNAQAIIRLTQPQDWAGTPAPAGQPEVKSAWKLWTDATVNIDKKMQVAVKGDMNIFDWQHLNFRLGTKYKGIAALREVRLDGKLEKEKLASRLSLKMGSNGSQIKALDFANCGLNADLSAKTGNFKCGPETVRLQLRERSLIRDPNFFLLRPEFDLSADHFDFGKTKHANFSLALRIVHHQFATLDLKARGSVTKGATTPLKYDVDSDLAFDIEKLQRVVKLFDKTPFEIPAPLNDLDGPVRLKAQAKVDQSSGRVTYQAATGLESKFQGVFLRANGTTDLQLASAFHQSTKIDLMVDDLRLSAPKFDLRAPPRFTPDSRFGPLNPQLNDNPPVLAKGKKVEPLDIDVRIHTTRDKAIQIATNLTKAPIPITLDVTYHDQTATVAAPNQPPLPLRSPAVVSTVPVNAGSTLPPGVAAPANTQPSMIGWVTIGHTPIDLFHRDANVEEMRVDLLPSGVQRVNGTVAINYLDYKIHVLVNGTTSAPAVKLISDPPLSDQNILAVLIYGHAPDELNDDQKSSVANAQAAFANATLGISSLYLLASTPIESVGYDPEKNVVTAKVGLGGGASLELGGGTSNSTAGFKKRLSKNFVFRTDVESNAASTGQKTVSALLEWVRRF